MPLPPPQMPQAAPPPLPGMPDGAPVESQMASPQMKGGDEAHADVQVQMAIQVLDTVLPVYGSGSQKGQAVLNCLKTLGRHFGGAGESKARELVPSEIMSLLSALPQGSAPGVGGAPMPPPAGA